LTRGLSEKNIRFRPGEQGPEGGGRDGSPLGFPTKRKCLGVRGLNGKKGVGRETNPPPRTNTASWKGGGNQQGGFLKKDDIKKEGRKGKVKTWEGEN